MIYHSLTKHDQDGLNQVSSYIKSSSTCSFPRKCVKLQMINALWSLLSLMALWRKNRQENYQEKKPLINTILTACIITKQTILIKQLDSAKCNYKAWKYAIWRNVALHHLFTNGSCTVNGCRQNESPKSWLKTSQ